MLWFKAVKVSPALCSPDSDNPPSTDSVLSTLDVLRSQLEDFISGVVPKGKLKEWDEIEAAWPEDSEEF